MMYSLSSTTLRKSRPRCSASASVSTIRVRNSCTTAVMTISSDELNVKNAMDSGLKADSEAEGRTIAQNLACAVQPDTLGLIMFGDGLTDTTGFRRGCSRFRRSHGSGARSP
jgi:hypothetical protein